MNVVKKEFKPWAMTAHDSFVMCSFEALKEMRSDAGIGYWKKTITDGSYTFAELNIPTIGFGPGSEYRNETKTKQPMVNDIERAVSEGAYIVHRNIGIPTFGWSSDEL